MDQQKLEETTVQQCIGISGMINSSVRINQVKIEGHIAAAQLRAWGLCLFTALEKLIYTIY